MAGKSNAGSAEPTVRRKMSDEQCKIVFEAFINIAPIGGKTDGCMTRRGREFWGPMAEALQQFLMQNNPGCQHELLVFAVI
jgi:hypothetical protein